MSRWPIRSAMLLPIFVLASCGEAKQTGSTSHPTSLSTGLSSGSPADVVRLEFCQHVAAIESMPSDFAQGRVDRATFATGVGSNGKVIITDDVTLAIDLGLPDEAAKYKAAGEAAAQWAAYLSDTSHPVEPDDRTATTFRSVAALAAHC